MTAYFPYKFHLDLIDILSENKDLFNIITYKDLCWDLNEPYYNRYLKEKFDWEKKISRTKQKNKIHILIQHDVDSNPERTMKLIKYEKEKNIKTNIMIFNLKSKGITIDNSYKLDTQLLSECENKGFVIGYHCNAYERANYDLDLAQEIFVEDVQILKKKFNINYFSAHGGQWNFDKTFNNKDIVVPKSLAKDLIWVHNGATPIFNKNYSDGGLANYKHLDQNSRDIRKFLNSMRIGGRYRILTHPQYYSDPCEAGELLSNSDWYLPMLNLYEKKEGKKFWLKTKQYFENVHLIKYKRANDTIFLILKEKISTFKNQIKKIFVKLKSYKKKIFKNNFIIYSLNTYEINSDDKPIFIKGMSRSGGTLLTSLLDCHPQISMSYELYPDHLDINLTIENYKNFAEKISNAPTRNLALKVHPNLKFLKVFVARAERGGLNYKEIGRLLKTILEQFKNNEKISENNCFQIISAFSKHKQIFNNKKLWGMKCNGNYEKYLSLWPRARFINIVRDGRDVLSSQLRTGSFNPDAKLLGKSWANTHIKFKKLSLENKKQFFQIKYEDLINDPHYELSRITAFLGIKFSDEMLQHHKKNLTIFKSNHISLNRLKLPINNNQIGRWKNELSASELDAFLSEADEALLKLGYKLN